MYFRIHRIMLMLAVLSFIPVLLAGCTERKKEETTATEAEALIISTTASSTTAEATTTSQKSDEEDVDTYIILDNEKTTINGAGAYYENGILTVNEGGAYYLTGTLSDGKIFVNSANDTKKVKLILAGVNVSCSTDAPVFVENSPDETVLVLQQDTQNYFSDTAREVPTDSTDYATAAIYSKDDLQIEGEGELVVNGNFGKGIFSKNGIDIRGGNITVNAADDGIRGKDSVEISAGTLNIICGGDGIRTSEETETDKGNIDISGGTITVTSGLDGIQAVGNLTVSAGTLTVTTAGGSTGDYSYQDQGMGSPVRGFFNPSDGIRHDESSLYGESSIDTESTKGIKADDSIKVSGGILRLNCLDDSIHASDVTISGGDLKMSSDDDGIHGDENVAVSGGQIVVTQSYEGVEGHLIDISGGVLLINASDDGFNAASSDSTAQTVDQPDQVNLPNMRGNMGGMMDYDSSCNITVSDGLIIIFAQGDGIDSNGNANMTGGKMIVFGPTNGGNGALDYGGTFTVSGGTLLATGSIGMAQSVSGNGVEVMNFNFNGKENTNYAITDSQNNCIIGFTAQKQFQNVVFASDRLSSSSEYSFREGGQVTGFSEKIYGICFDGVYQQG